MHSIFQDESPLLDNCYNFEKKFFFSPASFKPEKNFTPQVLFQRFVTTPASYHKSIASVPRALRRPSVQCVIKIHWSIYTKSKDNPANVSHIKEYTEFGY